jgi:hypothetical protein
LELISAQDQFYHLLIRSKVSSGFALHGNQHGFLIHLTFQSPLSLAALRLMPL